MFLKRQKSIILSKCFFIYIGEKDLCICYTAYHYLQYRELTDCNIIKSGSWKSQPTLHHQIRPWFFSKNVRFKKHGINQMILMITPSLQCVYKPLKIFPMLLSQMWFMIEKLSGNYSINVHSINQGHNSWGKRGPNTFPSP